MKIKTLMIVLLCVMFSIVIPVTGKITYSQSYPDEHLPTMDVWFESGSGRTYIDFFNIHYSLMYQVTLFDESYVTKSGPHPLNVDVSRFEDFLVPIEHTDHIVLEYIPSDNNPEILIDYQVPNLGVTEVNVKTDIITGFADSGDPVEVIVFEGDMENPISYTRVCDTSTGYWTADFSGPDEPLDLTTQSMGIVVLRNALKNSTIMDWRAPNPEFMVNPMMDTVNGEGWLGKVTVIVNYGGEDEQSFIIVPDSETGKFENVSLGMDLYPGQIIHISDYMIEHLMVVSNIAIAWMNIETDQVMLTENPYGYVQIFILSGTPPYDINIEAIVDGFADENGEFLVDFSEGGLSPYDLTAQSWGFIRNYDGLGNATLYEWSASDYHVLVGDLNSDGTIDKADMKLLVNIISGKIECTPELEIKADINNDGNVNALDVKALKKILK